MLTHSPSDESLFDDLKHVVSAPQPLLSHLVGSRTREDRDELKRILTHLPSVRETRLDRTFRKKKESEDAGAKYSAPQVAMAQQLATPRPASTPGFHTPRGAVYTPRGSTPRGSYPLVGTPNGTAAMGRAQTAPSATPRGTATPRNTGTTPRLTGAAVVRSPPKALPPPSTTPPRDVPLSVQAWATPLQEPGPPSPAAERAASTAAERAAFATKKAMELRGEKALRSREDEKKSQAEATQRVIEKLAELGIDPEGMSATDILRIFYARGSGSSYWLANREAEKRLNIRASTPRSFGGVLKPRAEREVRRARDLPVTNVHEYLDQWEITFLGDICRSLRCFDEAAEGNSTEYMSKYTNRQYGGRSGRKAFNRPMT